MPATQFGKVIQHIHSMAAGPRGPARTDRQLLDIFSVNRDQEAFAALVSRHGPMVFRVCWRVLNHDQDAEDAFQAVFLVLAQNSSSLRKREALAEWLHGVAYRTAMKAKRTAARRRNHEAALQSQAPTPRSGPLWDDVQLVLDEEIQRLPKAYKAAFVLCVLQGKTGPQAARELDIALGTVSSRLTWARKRLQQRLSRRGIELSALLVALSLTESVSRALPAHLASPMALAGLIATAGGTATRLISPHVAALAAGVSRAMFLSKAKIATGFLLAVGVFATGAALARQAIGDCPMPLVVQAPSGPAMTTLPNNKERPSSATDKDTRDAVTYSGQVLGPDGKPIEGAKVYYHFGFSREEEPHPVMASTDAEGRFTFTLGRKQAPDSAGDGEGDPLRTGHVIVKAEGFTYAWSRLADGQDRKQPIEQVFKLSRDDTAVEGRILDLEGKPVPGLRVAVLSAAASSKADLSDFIRAVGAHRPIHEAFRGVSNYLVGPLTVSTMANFLPSTTTNKDGRFRLRGFAKEQVLELLVEGEPIESQILLVMTRPRPADSPAIMTLPWMEKSIPGNDGERTFVLWNGFDHALPPGRVVVGNVRDEKTGQVIPRAIVESYQLAGTALSENAIYHTVADNTGHYRLVGLPLGKGNRVRIRPPADLPYLPMLKDVPVAGTLGEALVNANLERGIWAYVTTRDKSTDKPVSGFVSYFVLPEGWSRNRTYPPAPATRYSGAFNNMRIRPDGTYRFVAAPGRAIATFRADSNKYPIPPEASALVVSPALTSFYNFAAFLELNPKPDDESVRVNFVLDPGHTVHGKLLDPASRPVAGVLATALRSDSLVGPHWPPLRTAEFTVAGLEPNRPRLVCFLHLEMKLAGSLVARAEEDSAKVVKLMPWGTVSGRLLDAQGEPIKHSYLQFTEYPKRKPGLPMSLELGEYIAEPMAGQADKQLQTDEGGRFTIDRFIPGLKYNLAVLDRNGSMKAGLAFTNQVLKPGESKNLGDVTLQPLPEE